MSNADRSEMMYRPTESSFILDGQGKPIRKAQPYGPQSPTAAEELYKPTWAEKEKSRKRAHEVLSLKRLTIASLADDWEQRTVDYVAALQHNLQQTTTLSEAIEKTRRDIQQCPPGGERGRLLGRLHKELMPQRKATERAGTLLGGGNVALAEDLFGACAASHSSS